MKSIVKPIFIIEHLEPQLYEWCLIEYENISKIVGAAKLWFTNIKAGDVKKLAKYGTVFTQSVKSMHLPTAAILDPAASRLLTPTRAQKHEYFIFGGILGDHPPKKRTEPELTRFLHGVAKYHIGPAQFSTDNATYVVSQIIKGTPLTKMKFQDSVEIKINKVESTILPYRYLLVKNKPLLSTKLRSYLRNQTP